MEEVLQNSQILKKHFIYIKKGAIFCEAFTLARAVFCTALAVC